MTRISSLDKNHILLMPIVRVEHVEPAIYQSPSSGCHTLVSSPMEMLFNYFNKITVFSVPPIDISKDVPNVVLSMWYCL